VDGRGLRPAVDGRDAAEDVLLIGLGVLDEDVEIAALLERLPQRVDQLELGRIAAPPRGFPPPARRRERDLRILVEHLHVGVGGRAVEVVVVLLHVLAVVALVAGQPKEPLLEDGVALVPQADGQTQVLEAVADPGQAVLVPAVGAAAGVVVGEVVPGFAVAL
jgi:hypothetical protein